MDVSLDEYITKSNFKMKVGNPNFKGDTLNTKQTAIGFQTSKMKLLHGQERTEMLDASTTMPGVQKTGFNTNKTNQFRDARERLIEKNKPKDARELLIPKMQSTDARQKLLTIQAQKKNPIDARAKIQAKKQQGTPGQVASFTLTRTVTNKNNNNLQLTPGTQGNVNITKTLTKVMPPGYESVTGTSTTTKSIPSPTKGPTRVKHRLGPRLPPGSETGPPQVQGTSIPHITRTITNSISATPSQTPIHYYTQPQSAAAIYPPHPHQPIILQQVPQEHNQPGNLPPVSYGSVPPQQYSQAVDIPLYHYQSPPPNHPSTPQFQYGPPVHVQHQGYVQPQQLGQEVHAINLSSVIPRIQVQNDQYRSPDPMYSQYAAPYPQQYSIAPYSYTPPPQPMYYQTQQLEQNEQSTGPFGDSSTPVYFSQTVFNDVPSKTSVVQSSPLKRKIPGGPLILSSTMKSNTSTSNYVPIIDTTVSAAKSKLSQIIAPEEPYAKKLKEEDDDDNVISPLQGFKIVITNLATTVTQDDIIELFGAVGTVKYVKFVKQGTAEVLYVNREDAINGTIMYHDRELDGLPMVVKMVTPVSARIKEMSERLPSAVKPAIAMPLKLSKPPVGISKVSEKQAVDVGILHKALFRSGSSSTSKPVVFTVNI